MNDSCSSAQLQLRQYTIISDRTSPLRVVDCRHSRFGTALTSATVCPSHTELAVGPLCMTRSNPTRQLQVERRTGKVRQSETDDLYRTAAVVTVRSAADQSSSSPLLSHTRIARSTRCITDDPLTNTHRHIYTGRVKKVSPRRQRRRGCRGRDPPNI